MRTAKDKLKKTAGGGAKTSRGGTAKRSARRHAGRRACNKPSGGGALSEREALALLNGKLEVLERQAAFLNFVVQETIDLIK